MSGFLNLFRRRPPPFTAPLAMGEVVSVVGDVHGAAGKLSRLLPRLPGRVVLVGDLVDRGEDVAETLDLVMGRPEILCLMGNHEAMLLDFLGDPVQAGPRWLRHGGLQTLASYGVGGDISAAGLPRLRDRLAMALGDDCIDWLHALPRFWTAGNLAITHAGADPARPLTDQNGSLLWGHPDCGRKPRTDGLWIAQGHVILPEPRIEGGLIMVDTGAYAGGPLTAAVLGDGEPRFETE